MTFSPVNLDRVMNYALMKNSSNITENEKPCFWTGTK